MNNDINERENKWYYYSDHRLNFYSYRRRNVLMRRGNKRDSGNPWTILHFMAFSARPQNETPARKEFCDTMTGSFLARNSLKSTATVPVDDRMALCMHFRHRNTYYIMLALQ